MFGSFGGVRRLTQCRGDSSFHDDDFQILAGYDHRFVIGPVHT
jgi:hypothetical protein